MLKDVYHSHLETPYDKLKEALFSENLSPPLHNICLRLLASCRKTANPSQAVIDDLSLLRQQPPEACADVVSLATSGAVAYNLLSYGVLENDRRKATELWVMTLRRGGVYNVDAIPRFRFPNKRMKILFVGMFILRKINTRVAVASSVFRDRWQTIVRLDPSKYEKHLLLSPDLRGADKASDEDIKTLLSSVQSTQCLPSGDFRSQVEAIRRAKFDAVVFTSIGMHPASTFLAMNRLAPVQLTTWGHSCTSGIDTTMDHFVSSELYEEGGGGQNNYTENLVLHKSLGTCYRMPTFNEPLMSRKELGLPEDGQLMSCLQSPLKLTPHFIQDVLGPLARRGGACLLLLSSERDQEILNLLGCSNVVFVPRCTVRRFHSYIKCSTLVLDVHPFGGCNGSLEAFDMSRVVLTWPSNSLPGRFTLGFYRKMGLGENNVAVVDSAHAYVEAGVRLLSDENMCRSKLEVLICSRSASLFDDNESICEWDEMLTGMIESSRMPPPPPGASIKCPLRFVHITKTAGTSIEDHFLNHLNISVGRFHTEYGPWHEPFFQKNLKLQLKYHWFTVVRNPYDRLISELHCRWHGAAGKQGMDLSASSANRLLREQIRLRPVANWHYVPQYKYLPRPDAIRKGVQMNILRYESLSEELTKLLQRYGLNLGELPRSNQRRETYMTTDDIDLESLSLINSVYKKDFEMFGYTMRPVSADPVPPSVVLSSSPPRVCVMVVTCHKNLDWILRRIKSCPDGVYCLLGEPNLSAPFIIGNDRVIRLRCSDLYLGLPEKIVMATNAFCMHQQLKAYTHMYKVDDVDFDKYTFCCPSKVQDLMECISKRHYCGGSLNPILHRPNRKYHFKANEPEFFWDKRAYTGEFVEYLQGGDGYILSRASAEAVRNVWSDIEILRRSEPYEDLMVGKALSQHQILPCVLPNTARYILPIRPPSRINITYVTGLWHIANNPKRDFETGYKALVTDLLQTVIPGQNILFYYGDEKVMQFVQKSNTRGCTIIFEKISISSLPTYEIGKEYVVSCTRQEAENKQLRTVLKRMSSEERAREKGVVHAVRDLKSGAYHELFTVWTSKIFLVQDAIRRTAFSESNDSQFAWIDAGVHRFGLDPLVYRDDTRQVESVHLFRSPTMLFMGAPLPVSASFMIGGSKAWGDLHREFLYQLQNLKHTVYGHDEETILYHVWLQQGKSSMIRQIEEREVDYDFIEIGTSNFNTLTERASEKTRGLAVEPLWHYLSQLPSKQGVSKDNVAVSSKPGKARVYFIPESQVLKHKIPEWFKGCNSLHSYHPLHIRHNVTHLCRTEEVDVVTPEQLWLKHRVRKVGILKTDTEGHDCVILESLHGYLSGKPRHLWPSKIQFESNEHTPRENVDRIIRLYRTVGYYVSVRGHDTLMCMLTFRNVEILTPAKVGSTAFRDACESAGFNTHHGHSLQRLRNILESGSNTVIIVGARNPVDRNLSYLFQTCGDNFYNDVKTRSNGYRGENCYAPELSLKTSTWKDETQLKGVSADTMIQAFFARSYHNTFNEWFQEFFDLTKIKSFNREKGLDIYTFPRNVTLVLYTLEKLEGNNTNALCSLLGIPHLRPKNVSGEKDYAALYKETKKRIKYSSEYVRKVLTKSDVVSKLYTKRHIDEMAQKFY